MKVRRPSGIPWAPVWAPIEKYKEVDFGRYSRGPPLWAPIGKHKESKSGGIPVGLHCGPPQWAPIEKHSESKSSGIPVGPHNLFFIGFRGSRITSQSQRVKESHHKSHKTPLFGVTRWHNYIYIHIYICIYICICICICIYFYFYI